MDARFDKFSSEVHVVVNGVLGFVGAGQITRITDGPFNNTSSFSCSVNAQLKRYWWNIDFKDGIKKVKYWRKYWFWNGTTNSTAKMEKDHTQ